MIVKGAVDRLLELTERIWTKDGVREITEADKEKIQMQNQDFSMEGLRVLAFTYREIPENHILTMEDEKHLVFLGLIAMMDPPREESKAAVAECIKAGIRPVMITEIIRSQQRQSQKGSGSYMICQRPAKVLILKI